MAYQDGAEVLPPRVQSFHFPAAFVSPQGPTVLGFELLAMGPTRADQLHSSFGPAGSERITLVGLLSYQRLRLSIDNTLGESGFNKGDSRRRSTRIVDGDGKASAVCHCHDPRTFAPLGLSPIAPFVPQHKGAVDETL
jgi:hypothetical protein